MIVCTVSRVSTYLLNTHIPTLCPGLPPQRASMAQNLRCCAGLDQRPQFDVQFSVRSRARARRSVLLRFSRRQTVLSLLPGPSPEIHSFTFFCSVMLTYLIFVMLTSAIFIQSLFRWPSGIFLADPLLKMWDQLCVEAVNLAWVKMPTSDRSGVKILDDPEKVFTNTKEVFPNTKKSISEHKKRYFQTHKKVFPNTKKVFPNTKKVFSKHKGGVWWSTWRAGSDYPVIRYRI